MNQKEQKRLEKLQGMENRTEEQEAELQELLAKNEAGNGESEETQEEQGDVTQSPATEEELEARADSPSMVRDDNGNLSHDPATPEGANTVTPERNTQE